MKKLLAVITAMWIVAAAPHASADLIIPTTSTQPVTGLTLGNAISFDYMFSDVVYVSGSWLGINATVTNPLLGALQFNDYKPSNTGWLSGSINTSSAIGTLHDLAFTASNFGVSGNSATVTIRNIAIDGRVIGVPEPETLSLLGAGLLGLGFLRRKRAA